MTARLSLLAALLGLSMAHPLAAQDITMLNHFAGGLKKAEGTKLMSAAAAACIIGAGNAEAAGTVFTDAGWSRSDDAEMGETTLTRDGTDVSVMFYDGGKICDVSSETIPTDGAISALQVVAGGSGLSLTSIDNPDGCDAYQLSATASVVISSTGQDPSCSASPTSALRITFADTM